MIRGFPASAIRGHQWPLSHPHVFCYASIVRRKEVNTPDRFGYRPLGVRNNSFQIVLFQGPERGRI